MSAEQCDNIVDFALEALHGCRTDCYGCNVNKTDQDGISPDNIAKLNGLFDDLLAHDFVLANLAIGPTDFFMANNTEEVMKQIAPLMGKFCCVVLNSTFLYPKEELERMAKLIRPYLLGHRVKLAFPVDPRHLGKTKYIDTLGTNIRYFIDLLTDVTVLEAAAMVNLKVYQDVQIDPIWNIQDTIELFDQHRLEFGGVVVSEGRLDMKDLNSKEKLKKSFLYVKKIQDENPFPQDLSNLLHLTTYYREGIQLYGIDSQGRKFRDVDFVYKNGKIYNTVFSGEAVSVFHDSLAIDNSIAWDAAALMGLRNRILVEQIEHLEKTKECSSCEFASSCMERGYIQVMKIVGTRQCIVSKKTYEQNRNVLQSVSHKRGYKKPLHEENHSNPTTESSPG